MIDSPAGTEPTKPQQVGAFWALLINTRPLSGPAEQLSSDGGMAGPEAGHREHEHPRHRRPGKAAGGSGCRARTMRVRHPGQRWEPGRPE